MSSIDSKIRTIELERNISPAKKKSVKLFNYLDRKYGLLSLPGMKASEKDRIVVMYEQLYENKEQKDIFFSFNNKKTKIHYNFWDFMKKFK
ncbi:hypothetical protein CMO90_01650 [Candidatus Woesearchaeota archaeon]|nr:hypothetical protein [Candidatus Woesearchaeota archaeon]